VAEFGGGITDAIADASGTEYRCGLGHDEILPYYASGVISDRTFDLGIMSATIEAHPVVKEGDNLDLGGFILGIKALKESCTENYNGLRSMIKWLQATTMTGSQGDGSEVVVASSRQNASSFPLPTEEKKAEAV
jgi:hypothetical protein